MQVGGAKEVMHAGCSRFLGQRIGFEPHCSFDVLLILAGHQQKLRQSGLSSQAIEPENT